MPPAIVLKISLQSSAPSVISVILVSILEISTLSFAAFLAVNDTKPVLSLFAGLELFQSNFKIGPSFSSASVDTRTSVSVLSVDSTLSTPP